MHLKINWKSLLRIFETGRLLHFEKLHNFREACLTNDSEPCFHLQQLAGFTSELLVTFKSSFGELHERTSLFKFITHPHECAVDEAHLTCIPGVSISDFEMEVADLTSSDMWVGKFKSHQSTISWKELHVSEHSLRANTSGLKWENFHPKTN